MISVPFVSSCDYHNSIGIQLRLGGCHDVLSHSKMKIAKLKLDFTLRFQSKIFFNTQNLRSISEGVKKENK